MLRKGFMLSSGLLLGFIIWIIVNANTGQPIAILQWLHTVPNGDKWGHLVLATVLTLSFNGMFAFRTTKLGPIPFYFGTLTVAALAFMEELTQFFIPNRTVELYDLLADGAGLLLGTFLAWCMATQINAHKDKP